MKKFKLFILSLYQSLDLSIIRKTDLIAHKVVFNWQNKKHHQILTILQLEVQFLLEKNPGYKLRGYKKPIMLTSGGLLYKIILKKK